MERDETYIKAATERLKLIALGAPEDLNVTRSKKEEPRVPFGQVVEAGFIRPGDTLVSPDGKRRARVRPDGSLLFGDLSGSIHRMGAAAMGATACNGWTYWHIETDTGRTPIDLFRREIRLTL